MSDKITITKEMYDKSLEVWNRQTEVHKSERWNEIGKCFTVKEYFNHLGYRCVKLHDSNYYWPIELSLEQELLGRI